jgi:hypothetical protein
VGQWFYKDVYRSVLLRDRIGDTMAQTTFNIPDESMAKIVEALVNLYPIPMVPSGDTEGDPLTSEVEMVPEYDVSVHPEVCVKNWLVEQVGKWEQEKAAIAAIEAAKSAQESIKIDLA